MDENFRPPLDESLFNHGSGQDSNDSGHFNMTIGELLSEHQKSDNHGQHSRSEHYTGLEPQFSLDRYDGFAQQHPHVQHVGMNNYTGINTSNGLEPQAGLVKHAGLDNLTGIISNNVLEPQAGHASHGYEDDYVIHNGVGHRDGLKDVGPLSLGSTPDNISSDEGDVADDKVSNVGTFTQQAISKPKRQQKLKGRGELREVANGNLIFKDPKGNELPATYLTEEVREEMITEMSRLGTYKNNRRDGSGKYDRTCFHVDQTNWGEAREDWPDILYQHNKPEPPAKRKRFEAPGFMMHHDKVVIDYQSGKPLRDFPHIPKCLSSKEEGWLLEAMRRLDNRVTHNDLRDRMPYWGRPENKDLSMRCSRFRWNSGLKSWITRSASDKINHFLDSVVPKECQKANSTRGWDGLEPHEKVKIKELSLGEYPERARKVKRAMEAEDAAMETERPIRTIRKHRIGKNRAASTPSTVPSRDADQSAKRKGRTATTNHDGQSGTTLTSEPLANTVHADQPEHQHGAYAGGPYGQIYYPAADFRYKVPACQAEQRLIQRALAPTRLVIEQRLNLVTRPTNLRASYLSQWEALYRHFYAQLSTSFGRAAHPGDIGRHGAWMYAFPYELYQDVAELPATAGDQI